LFQPLPDLPVRHQPEVLAAELRRGHTGDKGIAVRGQVFRGAEKIASFKQFSKFHYTRTVTKFNCNYFLAKGVQEKALLEYLRLVRNRVPEHPTVYLDDSDVVKPEGQRFEALGIVRDGSASTEKKNVYEKGYHVTEACNDVMDVART
jgi:hypothetical protein